MRKPDKLLLLRPSGISGSGPDVRGAGKLLRLTALLGALRGLPLSTDGTLAQVEHLVVCLSATGARSGPEFGMPPSKRPEASPGITWLRFPNGQVAEASGSSSQGGLILSLKNAA